MAWGTDSFEPLENLNLFYKGTFTLALASIKKSSFLITVPCLSLKCTCENFGQHRAYLFYT